MNHALLILAATVGVDVGWQPLPDGGYEYIIQIEPETLQALVEGREIESDIPYFLRDVRSYRIRVGTDLLPQEGPPPEMEPDPSADPAAADWPGAADAADPGLPIEGPPADEPSADEPPDLGGIPPADEIPAADDEVPPADEGQPPADEEPTPATDDPPTLEGEAEDAGPVARPGDRPAPYGAHLDDRPGIAPPDGDETLEEETPQPFVTADEPIPLVSRAGYEEHSAARSTGEDDLETDPDAEGPQPDAPEEDGRPWIPFTLCLLGLFASVGGNCYLGLLTWGFRGRYMQLLEERKQRRRDAEQRAANESA